LRNLHWTKWNDRCSGSIFVFLKALCARLFTSAVQESGRKLCSDTLMSVVQCSCNRSDTASCCHNCIFVAKQTNALSLSYLKTLLIWRSHLCDNNYILHSKIVWSPWWLKCTSKQSKKKVKIVLQPVLKWFQPPIFLLTLFCLLAIVFDTSALLGAKFVACLWLYPYGSIACR